MGKAFIRPRGPPCGDLPPVTGVVKVHLGAAGNIDETGKKRAAGMRKLWPSPSR